ncbi:MAG: molybdopterin-dependent oxidoreductase [Acidobacteria bacterium]|nr:molybdopterin-dependent oxidoreductase [Acidobacteriota bacterium]
MKNIIQKTPESSVLSRRGFLQSLGGGITIIFSANAFAQEPKGKPAGGGGFGGFGMGGPPPDINSYLRVGEDGKITVFSGKIEQGQGNTTALAQMAAEELGVSLESITMVMGDTALCPYDMGTFGSMSIRIYGASLRNAAAEARTILFEMAAEKLGVPINQLAMENGAIFQSSDKNKRVTFAQLTAGQKITRKLEGKAVIRKPSEFTIIGKSPARFDVRAKVTGEAKFTADYRFSDMLYAKILRPPAHGAKLKSADTSEAEKMAGVVVVKEADMIAVLHGDVETAEAARAKIKAEYDIPEGTVDENNIFDDLLPKASKPQTPARENAGDEAAGEKASAEIFEHSWFNGYGAHAQIEPLAALAWLEGDKINLHISTQTPFMDQSSIASTLKMPQENVRVIAPYVGGGFGGKSSGSQGGEAARLAKATGKPVLVAYTREEAFFYDAFRPAAIVKIKSGVDAGGKLSLWAKDIYFAGDRSAEMFYDVPNKAQRVYGGYMSFGPSAHPFATGAWRAPGANLNVFARESQIDIMAAKIKMDPLEFRLKNTSDKRARAVLEAAAERFGYKPAPAPSGRGIGIACAIDAESYVAEIAEIELNAQGGIVVRRIVAAQDMGIVVHHDGAVMQMEGCIMMGLGYTLTEELQFRGGKILTTNFHNYRLPRFSMLPKIEAFVIKNDELEPKGGGEPAICPVGGAVANALFDLVGARVFQMPLTPERIKAVSRLSRVNFTA